MTIKFNNTDLFRLEDEFNLPIHLIMQKLAKGDFKLKDLYLLLWVGSNSDKAFKEFANENTMDYVKDNMPLLTKAITDAITTGEKKKKPQAKA